MKRLLPLLLALTAVVMHFPRLAAQRQVFGTGTPAEIARARDLGLEHLRVTASGKGIDGPNDLAVSRTHVDRLSMAHTRVQQSFRGVRVLGGEAIAHFNPDGTLFGETDALVPGIDVDTTPRLTPAAAIDIAAADYGCRTCLTETPAANLWILRDGATDHLVYRVQMKRFDGSAATAMPVRFVDAHGGFVVRAYDNLQTGTGHSLYSGVVPIGTRFNPMFGDYAMENHSLRIGTFDVMNNSSSPGNPSFPFWAFFDPDDVWDSPSQRAGVDAHYGMEKYYEYLSDVHGRNGIDGLGGPFTVPGDDPAGTLLVASLVHYGVGFNNAFWTGSAMIYGDGDGSIFSPLVTLDIAGHEMTHGLTQFTADLVYQGESGALNESWSDVFGAMLERFVVGESANTWLVAENAFTPGTPGDALRYMDDPHRAPDSGLFTADDDPDHYSERYTGTDDNGGVHINSGIANKAFYLLAKGGTHHLGGSMTGIGADDASRIWFNALNSFMTTSTDFAGARLATVQAATALFGSSSAQVAGVENAWCMVGVGACHVVVAAVSVTPSSGVGLSQAFTFAYTDSAGVAADLVSAQVRIAATDTAAGSCTVEYAATTGLVRMQDDAGVWGAWTPFAGGALGNSQCTVDLALSSAAASGTDLALTLHVTFAAAYTGSKNIYMRAAGAAGADTGSVLRGTWRVGPSLDAVSITPASGIGLTQTFALAYVNGSGVTADLTGAQVRFAATNTAAGSCTIHYRATTAMVRMQNDAGAWGAWTSFGNGTLGNSQCSLNLAQSSAAANGVDLTLNLHVTFTAAFSGEKHVFMRAVSASATSTAWLDRGTWTAGLRLDAISVTPNTGVGVTQSFALAYTDELGVTADLVAAQVRFAATNTAAGSCTIHYRATTGMARMQDDAGAWGLWKALGSGTLENSQCSLDLAQSSATPNGTDLTLVLRLTFKAGFKGLKNIFMRAASATGPTVEWPLRGSWMVTEPGPNAVSVTPGTGTGFTQAFTLRYWDSFGASDLTSVRVRFSTASEGPGSCTARYDPLSGFVSLMNDAGTGWTQGVLGIGALSNSQCTLNLATSAAAPTGNDLTVVLNITFQPGFGGQKSIHMLASNAGGSTGWQLRGGWLVPVAQVSAVSVAPNTGSGAAQAFTLEYSHSFGASNLTSVRVRFGASNVGPGTCTAKYDPSTGTVELMNDAGTAWAAGTMGVGTLSNGQCTLSLASSSATANGTQLTVVLDINFNTSFAGQKQIYMLATSGGVSTGWQQRGTWTGHPLPPATALFIDSEPGEPIGGGTQRLFTPPDATFTLARPFNGAVTVSVIGPQFSFLWHLNFSTPDNAFLQVGNYYNATPYAGAQFVGMSVAGDGLSCGSLTGRFDVLEAVYDVHGNVERFAVDFEQHCDDENPGLFGALRYNSSLSLPLTPFGGSYPLYGLRIQPPTLGNVSGGPIDCGNGGLICDATLSSRAPITLSATVNAGSIFSGWAGKCHGGRTISVQVNTKVTCEALITPTTSALNTLLLLNSQQGDYVGQGARDVYSPPNSRWTFQVLLGGGIRLSLKSAGGMHNTYWELRFEAPTGLELAPGVYENAELLRRPHFGAIDVSGSRGSCQDHKGRFTVHELTISGGVVTSLALDFEQRCVSQSIPLLRPPLYGSIRYNSAVAPAMSLALTIAGPGQVTISPSGTICTSDCIETYQPETAIQLTATPDPGWSFVSWSGDDDCTDGMVLMTAPTSCAATFQQVPFSPVSGSSPQGGQASAAARDYRQ